MIQPSMQLVLLFVICMGLLFIGKTAWSRRGFALWLFLFLLYATPFLPHGLVSSLEMKHPVAEAGGENVNMRTADYEYDYDSEPDSAHEQKSFIIVLGAAYFPDPKLDYTHMLSEAVMMRLAEGMRLYNKIPESVLVTSASTVVGELSQAEVLRRAAIRLGADPDRIRTQDDPVSTCTEAEAFVRDHGHHFNDEGGDRSMSGSKVYIATSALHMRRAVAAFQGAGIPGESIFAAPSNYMIKNHPEWPFTLWDYLPRWENVLMMDQAVKEHAGYIMGCR
ncbi:MAG: YdcF family protein [Balneolia bacterium]|nr:YdcF family protein [Balneolia bacterium]